MATTTRPRHPAAATSAAWRWPRLAACGTRDFPTRSTRRRCCSPPFRGARVSQTDTPRAGAGELIARPPLRSLVDDLHERRDHAKLGGGPDKIERQHADDKLTARERLALLIDEGMFTELGIHGRPHFSQRAMEGKEAAADGVVTGYGKVDGRLVAVCAYDFTVMAGSMGMTGELKVARLRELALQKRIDRKSTRLNSSHR